jgi:hypothetical protein
MAETRKLAAILAADVAGYSKLAGADEERTLARLRALRSDLIDPTVALHHGRVVKRPALPHGGARAGEGHPARAQPARPPLSPSASGKPVLASGPRRAGGGCCNLPIKS